MRCATSPTCRSERGVQLKKQTLPPRSFYVFSSSSSPCPSKLSVISDPRASKEVGVLALVPVLERRAGETARRGVAAAEDDVVGVVEELRSTKRSSVSQARREKRGERRKRRKRRKNARLRCNQDKPPTRCTRPTWQTSSTSTATTRRLSLEESSRPSR